MALVKDSDIMAIKEWMAKENHLPQPFDDFTIKKFLHSCYGSLEKTKKCIECFCGGRYNMPEIYTNRDPYSAKIKQAFSIAHVATFPADNNEILCHFLELPDMNKFDYYDCVKTFAMQADYWIKTHDSFPDGHILIWDISYITLRLVPKANLFHFQKLLVFLLDSMPVRIKKIHILNYPSYYEKLYALVKPVLPQEICDIVTFHKSNEELHKQVDKKFLPKEFGGDAPSLKTVHLDWVRRIENDRKMFQDDDYWKADLSKKQKTNGEDIMNGSFRTLSID